MNNKTENDPENVGGFEIINYSRYQVYKVTLIGLTCSFQNTQANWCVSKTLKNCVQHAGVHITEHRILLNMDMIFMLTSLACFAEEILPEEVLSRCTCVNKLLYVVKTFCVYSFCFLRSFLIKCCVIIMFIQWRTDYGIKREDLKLLLFSGSLCRSDEH